MAYVVCVDDMIHLPQHYRIDVLLDVLYTNAHIQKVCNTDLIQWKKKYSTQKKERTYVQFIVYQLASLCILICY